MIAVSILKRKISVLPILCSVEVKVNKFCILRCCVIDKINLCDAALALITILLIRTFFIPKLVQRYVCPTTTVCPTFCPTYCSTFCPTFCPTYYSTFCPTCFPTFCPTFCTTFCHTFCSTFCPTFCQAFCSTFCSTFCPTFCSTFCPTFFYRPLSKTPKMATSSQWWKKQPST